MDNLVEHTDVSVEHAAREEGRRWCRGDGNGEGDGKWWVMLPCTCDLPHNRHQGLTLREKVPS